MMTPDFIVTEAGNNLYHFTSTVTGWVYPVRGNDAVDSLIRKMQSHGMNVWDERVRVEASHG